MALVVAFLLASSSKPSSKASSLETVVTLVDSPSVPESEVAPIPDPQIAAQARTDEAVARAEVDEQAAAELTARREALAGGSAIEQSTSEAAADAAREQSEAALAQVALQAAAEEAERQAELDVLVTPTPVPQPTATPQPTAVPQPTATPQPTAVPQPTATPQPTADPTGGPTATQWAAVRACESGGNYSINTGNGYYGAYQFSPVTWANLANSFMPEVAGILPHQASPAQQDAMAAELSRRYGRGQWPTCGLSLPA